MCQSEYQKKRMVLHSALQRIPGVKKVYFQPPSSEKIVYPCIIYQLNRYSTFSANNEPYLIVNDYTAMVIDSDPESCIHEHILKNRDCYVARFDRFYTADNLNHWVFDITLTNHIDNKEGNNV